MNIVDVLNDFENLQSFDGYEYIDEVDSSIPDIIEIVIDNLDSASDIYGHESNITFVNYFAEDMIEFIEKVEKETGVDIYSRVYKNVKEPKSAYDINYTVVSDVEGACNEAENVLNHYYTALEIANSIDDIDERNYLIQKYSLKESYIKDNIKNIENARKMIALLSDCIVEGNSIWDTYQYCEDASTKALEIYDARRL